MSYTRVEITVSSNSRTIVDIETGVALALSQRPSFHYGEILVLCVSFIDANLAPYALDSGDTFECSLDSDFVHFLGSPSVSDPLMAYAGNDAIDIAGDWDDIDRAQGKISIRLDCLTSGYLAKAGAKQVIPAYLEIRRFPVGTGRSTGMLLDTVEAYNSVHVGEAAPESADPEYRTAAEQASIDNALTAAITAEAEARAAADASLALFKLPINTATASADYERCMRYRTLTDGSAIEVCMKGPGGVYVWDEIMRKGD